MASTPQILEPQQPTGADLKAFLERHQYLLRLERDEEEEQTRLLNSNCSPKLLEQRGLALGSLGVSSISVGLGGKTLIELNRPLAFNVDTSLPPHTFRNGDPVRIEEHVSSAGGKTKGKKKAEDDNGVEGVVYRVGPEKVIVAVSESKEIDLPERLRLLKLANSVTFDRMRKTLEHLERLLVPEEEATPSATNFPLINSLVGLNQPAWSKTVPPTIAEPESTEIKWFGERLNDSQKEAIDFCLRAETVACIHGPPGKTHTLIELIFQFLARPAGPGTSQPPRILVTTPSNLALDNLLLRLHTLAQQPPYSALLPPGSVLRIGHPTRVHRDLVQETLDWRAANGDDGALVRDVGKEIEGHLGDLGKKRGERGAVKGRDRGKKWEEVRELRKEYRQRETKVVTNVVKGARVILATCHSAGARQLNNLNFDVAIVDEATQAVEAVCWVPILKAKKLILAGDPEQLPPTILSRDDKKAKKTAGKSSTAKTTKEQSDKVDKVDKKSRKEKKAASKPSESASEMAQEPAKAGEAAPTEEPEETDPDAEEATEAGESPVSDDKSEEKPEDKPEDQSEAGGASGTATPKEEEDITEQLDDVKVDGSKTKLRPPRTLETTLFDRLERLYGAGIKRVLKVQYRMNELIAEFPSVTLYNSELVSDASVAKHTLLDLPTITDTSDDAKDALEPTVVFFDTAGCEFYERADADDEGATRGKITLGEGSKSNENEATVVAKWARRLVSLGVPAAEVGIVAPYQRQVALLSSLLHEEFPEMTIGTVDGLQGQERDAIIVSLVRSNANGEVGFLGEYRRLNVAMTRPRRQLAVVGDSDTVAKGSSYLKKWMAWLEDKADVRYAGDAI